MRRKARIHLLVAMLVVCAAGSGYAQAQAPPPAAPTVEEAAGEPPTSPVVIDGDVLFSIRGLAAFTAERRAQEIAERVKSVAEDRSFSVSSLVLVEGDNFTQVMAGSRRVMAIFDADARLEGVERVTLAQATLARIREAIQTYRHRREPAVLARAALNVLVATVFFSAALLAGWWIQRRLRFLIEQRYRVRVRDVQIHSFQVVKAERLWRMVTGLLALAWVIFALVTTYVYLHFVLLQFPWSRALGLGLASMVAVPLRVIGGGAIAIVPNLVFLAVLVFVTRYGLRLIRLFFDSVAAGTVVFSSFDPEWAVPTYRLVRILVVAFAVVVAYPYVPGSQTDAFKGVSIFIGIVFSLGSSSLIGNVIAGYSMTYRRAFRVGDRVRVGEHVGDVDKIRLMETHLRTPKNEEIVIPNSQILSSEVINYSTLARQHGLILHTTVGIGYETPWRQVEAMLLEAADRTEGLLKEPEPFVLQRALGDFAVTYEVNAYCDTPHLMLALYAALHRNILDVFNEYGVQIMTPAYEGDPDRPKVVSRSDWYLAPAKPPESGGGTS
jgi:small-conductance mechanosensitive channel